MGLRRTNNGKPIDMDALMAASSSGSPAVGNMRVNANGDLLGAGGEIIKKNEDRVREYYQNNPKSSTASASLKGGTPSKLQPDTDAAKAAQPKTSQTSKENKRVEKPAQVVEPSEFDAPDDMEPLGFKERELPNGDIEMVPYYREEDK